MTRAELLNAATVMARSGSVDDATLCAALNKEGFSNSDAILLVAFMPMAFARPVLEEMGVSFVEEVSVPTRNGGWSQVPLADQPIYVEALAIAREHRLKGLIENEVFKVLALRSAELNAASNALNAGKDIKGATFASAFVSLEAESLLGSRGMRSNFHSIGRLWRRLTLR